MDRAACEALDDADPLRGWRERFRLPDDVVYLDGNSLGALPVATPARLREVVEQEWGGSLIRGWNDAGWYQAPRRVGDKIGSLVGAAAGEVVVADSTSVNIAKLLAAALSLRPGRRVVVMRRDEFPTDVYVVAGMAGLCGAELRLVDGGSDVSAGASSIGALRAALDDSCAALLVSHVDYVSGLAHDVGAHVEAAHAVGALAIVDLSHSAGALPIELDAAGVDMAVGCGYKFLCGGPGAPAFLFVAARHQGAARQPITGWFGHAAPFRFAPEYSRDPGIGHFLSGTPPVLGLAALETAVDLLVEVGDMRALLARSRALGELLIALVDERCAGLGVTVVSPRDSGRRGAHVALRVPNALAVSRALIARGVIGDMRPPDILRLGLAPLYTRFVDVHDGIAALVAVLEGAEWERPENLAAVLVS